MAAKLRTFRFRFSSIENQLFPIGEKETYKKYKRCLFEILELGTL